MGSADSVATVDRPLRVIFVGMRWDYGIRARGFSFEHQNFFDTLERMDDVEVTEFDFLSSFQDGGTDRVAADLRVAVDATRPRLAFFVLHEEELLPELIQEFTDRPGLTTYNWFCDDHWRFDDFSRRYAPMFDFVSTTDRNAIPKYQAIGIEPILTQWAANPHLYRPTGGAPRLDATFIGQRYGDRPWLVRRLDRAGIDVEAWGPRWPAGRLSFDEMVSVFSESRVNLNLTAASNDPSVNRYVRGLINRTYPPALHWISRRLDQIKGRTFEIPACGGFQLTSEVENLDSFFDVGDEVAVFSSPAELVEQTRRYLADDRERDRVARAGYERVLAEHTYERRFRAIFERMGL